MLQDRTWLLIGRKMADEASPQELKELEDILRSNPELHFSLQALTEIWQNSSADNLHEIESAYQAHLNKLKSELDDHPGSNQDLAEYSPFFAPAKPSFFKRNVFIAALLAVAILLTVAGIFYSTPSGTPELAQHAPAPVASEISTRNGSRSSIVLPDGTRVSLNAGSKLTYDKNFGENIRTVQLIGEAYFDVIHNAEKPFVIHTQAMEIKVLGTEFNVKSYPDERTTEASLIRGSIEVTLKDKRAEKIIMKPSEKLVVSNEIADAPVAKLKPRRALPSVPVFSLEHVNYFSQDSTILETSWVDNRLVFEDESFEQVATRMSRWYGVEFDFKDSEIQNLRFTGNFRNETVEEALKAMQITADFNYRIMADKHIIITKN